MAKVEVTAAMTRNAYAATSAQASPVDNDPFQEGDAVVYPAHGVGRIDRIGTQEVAGHQLQIIQISFLENQMTVRIPAAKARTSGLRKVATRETIDAAIGVIKGRPRVSKVLWARRAQEYQAKINTGDPMCIAEVLRDLRRNADSLDGSYSERQIFETALDRLAAEVAVLEGTDKAAALSQLTTVMKQA